MMTVEFITALFYEVDEQLGTIPKHPEAHLWPSEVVTLGLLHALKGVGNRPFYRWLTRDYRPLFPHLPERTRLFRLLKTHQDWTRAFLAAPTVLGVIDTYGIELTGCKFSVAQMLRSSAQIEGNCIRRERCAEKN